MRMVYNVINKILDAVPVDRLVDYKEMRTELELIKNASAYKAPEQMPPYFQAVSEILTKHLGEPNEPWKQRIADIFADKVQA